MTAVARTGVVSPTSVNTTSSVQVGCVDRAVWVKVEGRGTFQNSAGLKEFVKQMIQRGYRDFVVDLRDCEQMDSTFMGTLAGVALRLRELGQGGLRTINVNDRNCGLLEQSRTRSAFPCGARGDRVRSQPEELELQRPSRRRSDHDGAEARRCSRLTRLSWKRTLPTW